MPSREPWNRGMTCRAMSSWLRRTFSRGAHSVAVTARHPKPPERSWSPSMAAIASSGVPTTQLPASTIWSMIASGGPGTGRGRPVTPST